MCHDRYGDSRRIHVLRVASLPVAGGCLSLCSVALPGLTIHRACLYACFTGKACRYPGAAGFPGNQEGGGDLNAGQATMTNYRWPTRERGSGWPGGQVHFSGWFLHVIVVSLPRGEGLGAQWHVLAAGCGRGRESVLGSWGLSSGAA